MKLLSFSTVLTFALPALAQQAPTIIATDTLFTKCVTELSAATLPNTNGKFNFLSYEIFDQSYPDIKYVSLILTTVTGMISQIKIKTSDPQGWMWIQRASGELGFYAYAVDKSADVLDASGVLKQTMDIGSCESAGLFK